jgi:NAD(P)H dehydrogenase (quinone)
LHKILIVYFSRHGSIARMAEEISLGVDSNRDCEAVLRRLPSVSAATEQEEKSVPDDGLPFAQQADLEDCAGLLVGSPGYFGNMAAPLKYFFDQTSPLWLSGTLIGKPAGVFTATSSMHGGQETVLTSMMLPLLHHGMLVTGIPYSEPALNQTSSGATPYGASHVAGFEGQALSEHERSACRALGKRVADLASKLVTRASDA